jgi:hypothetical protein
MAPEGKMTLILLELPYKSRIFAFRVEILLSDTVYHKISTTYMTFPKVNSHTEFVAFFIYQIKVDLNSYWSATDRFPFTFECV